MKENSIILAIIISLGLLMGAFYYFENIWQNNSTAIAQNKTPAKNEMLPEPASIEIKLDAKDIFIVRVLSPLKKARE